MNHMKALIIQMPFEVEMSPFNQHVPPFFMSALYVFHALEL
jgi:hypothetical protein